MVTGRDVVKSARALAKAFPFSTNNHSAGKLYEAWLMLEIGLCLRHLKWKVDWHDPSNTNPPTMRFRGGPSSLYSNNRTAAGFLWITKNRHALEIHNSIRFLGYSGTLHEVDISAIKKNDAVECRRKNKHPCGLPILALELKHYTGDLGLGLTRSTLLASIDLSQAASANQFDGRSCQASPIQSPHTDPCSVGNLDDSIVRICTTANNTGSASSLAKFFGPKVISRMTVNDRHCHGFHRDIMKICTELDALFP